MKILITGGAGYIGSLLTGYLLERNYQVTVIDNFLYDKNSLNSYIHNKNFKVIVNDVRNYEFIKKIIKNYDLIVPLSALVGAPLCKIKEFEAKEINYDSIKYIADNISKNQLLIYPTTNSGYGIGKENVYCDENTPLNPISLYGKTKVNAENYIMQRENSIAFRLATVFGISNRMRLDLLVNDFVYKASKDGYIILFEEHFKRNYIHIRDVCRGFIHSIDNFDAMKSNVYNMGLSDANLSKLELCNKIKEYINNFTINVSEIGEDIDKRNYIVSNKKIENTGFLPKYSIDDGIIELIKLFSYYSENRYSRNI